MRRKNKILKNNEFKNGLTALAFLKNLTVVKKNNRPTLAGFSLLEIIVSLSLFVIIIILVNAIYIMSQRSYNRNASQAELSQNARVAFDRISRELRQSDKIITALPSTKTDPLNPPANQIFFQDGHDNNRITYLRYYLSGKNLMREHRAYVFNADPLTYVYYDSLDAGGSPPDQTILENRVVGEYIDDLKFWGANGVINFELALSKNQTTLAVELAVYSRNQ